MNKLNKSYCKWNQVKTENTMLKKKSLIFPDISDYFYSF